MARYQKSATRAVQEEQRSAATFEVYQTRIAPRLPPVLRSSGCSVLHIIHGLYFYAHTTFLRQNRVLLDRHLYYAVLRKCFRGFGDVELAESDFIALAKQAPPSTTTQRPPEGVLLYALPPQPPHLTLIIMIAVLCAATNSSLGPSWSRHLLSLVGRRTGAISDVATVRL